MKSPDIENMVQESNTMTCEFSAGLMILIKIIQFFIVVNFH